MMKTVLLWAILVVLFCVAYVAIAAVMMMAWNKAFVPAIDGTHPMTYTGALWLVGLHVIVLSMYKSAFRPDDKK